MKRKRKLLKVAGISLGILSILFCLFVVAFVFNPLEGSLVDLRDAVPREVDFFLRKQQPAADFAAFPEPAFWTEFAETQDWRELQKGPLVQSLKRDGAERLLQQAADGVREVREQTGGWIDPLRDLIGSEILLAGYFEDRTGGQPRPLPEPWWCMYTRVSWRVRAAWGIARWGIVQSSVASRGVEMQSDGPVLVIKLRNGTTFFAARHLDCLMLGNSRHLIDQALALIAGAEHEEPFGRSAKYTDGVLEQIRRWTDATKAESVNALEFSISPNLTDGFRSFAQGWPNPAHPDSMEQRVLASFLNLKGWNSISGALLFDSEPDSVSFLGEVVLNSHMHTPFQSQFFRLEQQALDRWLDPFLRMVPVNACAAAALRMPAGEFLHAMNDALAPAEKEELNGLLRTVSLQNQQLGGTRDLIERIKLSLLPRTGFVFRKNVPDLSRDEKTGNLMIPVSALSPTPQFAWVFWVRDGGAPLLDDVVNMLSTYAKTVFGFKNVYHLDMSLSGGGSGKHWVTEFANPWIPGTGEIATLVFRDFFVLSNSGPLIKDMFRARYQVGGARSIMELGDLRTFYGELPGSLNGFVYLRGPQLAEVLDDYRAHIEQMNRDPDAGWMLSVRAQVQDEVRRKRFAQYATVAGIPEALRADFEAAVVQAMRELWERQQRSGVTSADLASVLQLRAMCRAMQGAYVAVQLENNYIRYQGKVIADYR